MVLIIPLVDKDSGAVVCVILVHCGHLSDSDEQNLRALERHTLVAYRRVQALQKLQPWPQVSLSTSSSQTSLAKAEKAPDSSYSELDCKILQLCGEGGAARGGTGCSGTRAHTEPCVRVVVRAHTALLHAHVPLQAQTLLHMHDFMHTYHYKHRHCCTLTVSCTRAAACTHAAGFVHALQCAPAVSTRISACVHHCTQVACCMPVQHGMHTQQHAHAPCCMHLHGCMHFCTCAHTLMHACELHTCTHCCISTRTQLHAHVLHACTYTAAQTHTAACTRDVCAHTAAQAHTPRCMHTTCCRLSRDPPPPLLHMWLGGSSPWSGGSLPADLPRGHPPPGPPVTLPPAADDVSVLLQEIITEARNLSNAEICSVFLLDRLSHELVAKVFDGGVVDDESYEIRIPADQGIAGHVATTGKILNIKDAYSHPLFYRGVDDSTGFRTRNILCFPIKNESQEVIGVAELVNKINGPWFSKFDEDLATAFSIYCGISIAHSLLYKKVNEAQYRSHLANEMMMYHMKVSDDEYTKLLSEGIQPVATIDPNFANFTYTPRSLPEDDTSMAILSMLQDMNFINTYKMDRQTLTRFTGLGLGLRAGSGQGQGDPGCSSLQKSVLAALYSSEGSVMERHHFAQAIAILNSQGCNIFDHFSRKVSPPPYHRAWSLLVGSPLVPSAAMRGPCQPPAVLAVLQSMD
nr:cGMP-dependent 3',5'-cyclic phosphodiesterase [Anser cygnoides]